jgi:UDP-N-acetylmuramyl pentapeptide phosphotransferase/UDP-N-acetylglucosamine-1-phosphate transferase
MLKTNRNSILPRRVHAIRGNLFVMLDHGVRNRVRKGGAMAQRKQVEDHRTGTLTLRYPWFNRFAVWVSPLMFLLLWATPSRSGAPRSETDLNIILLLVLASALFAAFLSFSDDIITLDRRSRELTRVRALPFIRLAPRSSRFPKLSAPGRYT